MYVLHYVGFFLCHRKICTKHIKYAIKMFHGHSLPVVRLALTTTVEPLVAAAKIFLLNFLYSSS